MSYPKIKPCPTCKTGDHIAVYTYDAPGTFHADSRHVECTKCDYLGPGEGSILQAIKSHNERVTTSE